MVGQGVLRECLLDPDVHQVLSIVRTPTNQQQPKLRELVHTDFFDYSGIESQLTGFDACSSRSASPPPAWTKRNTPTSPTTSPSQPPERSPDSTPT